MARQGRKNVHGKTGVRFKEAYTSSKYKGMLRNVVTDLVVHDKVTVTSGVTKDLITLADHLVTLAKGNDLHSKRQAAAILRPVVVDKEKGTLALDKLFNEIGPKFVKRNGGYTKALKLGNRKGDNAEVCLVTWVD